jgi:hypothetical protein
MGNQPTTTAALSCALLGCGASSDGESWQRTFDRTAWVLTVWFPLHAGDSGDPAVWPSSPPFPAPFCADGVCEVSQGENAETCPTLAPPPAGTRSAKPRRHPQLPRRLPGSEGGTMGSRAVLVSCAVTAATTPCQAMAEMTPFAPRRAAK